MLDGEHHGAAVVVRGARAIEKAVRTDGMDGVGDAAGRPVFGRFKIGMLVIDEKRADAAVWAPE